MYQVRESHRFWVLFIQNVSSTTLRVIYCHNLLYVPKSKTDYYKRSFIISGSYLWNELNENLKECTTIESLKELYLQQVLWLILYYIAT